MSRSIKTHMTRSTTDRIKRVKVDPYNVAKQLRDRDLVDLTKLKALKALEDEACPTAHAGLADGGPTLKQFEAAWGRVGAKAKAALWRSVFEGLIQAMQKVVLDIMDGKQPPVYSEGEAPYGLQWDSAFHPTMFWAWDRAGARLAADEEDWGGVWRRLDGVWARVPQGAKQDMWQDARDALLDGIEARVLEVLA